MVDERVFCPWYEPVGTRSIRWVSNRQIDHRFVAEIMYRFSTHGTFWPGSKIWPGSKKWPGSRFWTRVKILTRVKNLTSAAYLQQTRERPDDGRYRESMAIAGLLVDRPVGWNIDEGDLGKIMWRRSVRRMESIYDIMSVSSHWYLISTWHCRPRTYNWSMLVAMEVLLVADFVRWDHYLARYIFYI